MLELQNVELLRGQFRVYADFALPDGGTTAIIGESGAGKSTLFDLIAGFAQPTKGCVIWNGTDLAGLSPADRPVSILFQDNNLFPHLSVFRNVALGVTTRGKPEPGIRERIEGALSRVGLAGFGSRHPGDLSGGQRSRVALARALVRERPLVLLDEPFSALGPALKAEMLDLTKDVFDASGATVLMITHDPHDARRIAKNTLVIADGCVQGPFETRDLLNNPPESLQTYFGK